jgi:pantoate--beta-alanine ligase
VQVIETIEGFRKALDAERHAGRTVGLVPTMGYLHAGHRSLMERSVADNDVTAVTLFVNPLQFAPTEDLAAYPRDLPADQALATEAGAAFLFTPSVAEMYPAGSPLTTVDVGQVSEPMEGRSRPTHFAGVATVVAKLFAIAGSCRAYFGEKDYQQLAVIRRMAADLSLPVEVIGCPTVREADGLALSSRNVYLTAEERAVAPLLHRALMAGRAAIEDDGQRDPAAVRRAMHDLVATEPRFTVDYTEVVDAHDLSTPARLSGDVRLLVAARLGQARLIDNMAAIARSEADQ